MAMHRWPLSQHTRRCHSIHPLTAMSGGTQPCLCRPVWLLLVSAAEIWMAPDRIGCAANLSSLNGVDLVEHLIALADLSFELCHCRGCPCPSLCCPSATTIMNVWPIDPKVSCGRGNMSKPWCCQVCSDTETRSQAVSCLCLCWKHSRASWGSH